MSIEEFRIYRGEGSPTVWPPSEPRILPRQQRDKLTDPAGYQADPGLIDAVNVALHLGKPLLLTGEAGTGKTILASSLAWELGYALEVYGTKSSSTATDLFYTYNALAQYNVSQLEGRGGSTTAVDADPDQLGLRYIRYNALGRAILRGCPKDKVGHLLPPGFDHPGEPTRSVVLLDEIDKSPRDLPNDVLSALDSMAFSIPELGNQRVEAEPDFRPVLVLTSNSEKALPDPFLRRCIFYHIPFPESTTSRGSSTPASARWPARMACSPTRSTYSAACAKPLASASAPRPPNFSTGSLPSRRSVGTVSPTPCGRRPLPSSRP